MAVPDSGIWGHRLDTNMGPYRHLSSRGFPTYIGTLAYHLPLGKC